MKLKEKINEYHDFPKKGILFRDFSPILKDPSALSYVVDELSKHFHPNSIDLFAGIESRGFLLASVMAVRYNKGMIMIRKAGKLPGKTVKQSYSIEYGNNTIEIQVIGNIAEGLIFTLLQVEQYEAQERLRIAGTGAEGSTLVIDIFDTEGEKIETLFTRITKAGDFTTLWTIPKEINPGTYTIEARDNFNTVTTTYVLD